MKVLEKLDDQLRRRSRISAPVLHWLLMTGVLLWILAAAWSGSGDKGAATALLVCGLGMVVLSVRLARIFFPRASLGERMVVVMLVVMGIGPLWVLKFIPDLEFLVFPWGFSLLALLGALLLWFCRMGFNGSLTVEELLNTGRVLLVLLMVNALGAGLLGWQVRDQPVRPSLSVERKRALEDPDARQRFEAAWRAFVNHAVVIPWKDAAGTPCLFLPGEKDQAAQALARRIAWGFHSIRLVLPVALAVALVAVGGWLGSIRRIRRLTVQGYFPRPKKKWQPWEASGKNWR